MPRQVRIEYAGAVYHVMCRGDRREAIFEDDQDRERFLATLGEAVARTGWRIHAYVLMNNHYHLLLETPEPNLVRGMTWFQTTCTVRHNCRHRAGGRLFGGRYKAILVDPESEGYFTTVLNYIHLNPVRAGVVRLGQGGSVADYPWSSLPGYAWRRRPAWLVVEPALAMLQWKDTSRDRRAFLAYAESMATEEAAGRHGWQDMIGEGQSLQSTLRRGWYFGTDAFREWLLEKAGAVIGARREVRQNYHGEEMRADGEAEARKIIALRLAEEGLSPGDLVRLRKSDVRKARIAAEVRARTSVPLRFVARELSMGTPMNVSRLTTRR